MRRLILVATLALLGTGVARAQVAVYVTSSSAHLSNVATGDVYTGSGYQEHYASYWSSGIGGGVTFNFLPLGPVKLGLDFRGSTKPGTTGFDTALGGVKLGFKPPLLHIKPYVQASAGYVATRTTNISTASGVTGGTIGGTFTNRYAAWEVLGGIDYSLAPFLDFRVIEIGGGMGVDVPGLSNEPNLSLFTVNTGLVLHF